MGTYTHTQILKITGLTGSQIIHWTEKGIIVPLKDTTGKGARRIYSYDNLLEFIICRDLRAFGFSTRRIIEIIDFFRNRFNKENKIINYDSENIKIQIDLSNIEKEISAKMAL